MIDNAGMEGRYGRTAGLSGEERRFLWVKRYDFRSAEDVARIVSRAAALRFTDLVWQVRGQADAFYRSELEVRGEEIGGTDFDPLAAALGGAGKTGLRLHAWVNAMPLWRGLAPPKNTEHLYHARPRWRMYDREGNEQPLNAHYVIANFCLAEVREHVAAVCRDIARRYPVAGVHLDYIRFVSETMAPGAVYPGDSASLRLFAAESGHEVDLTDSPDFKAAFDDWRRSKITDLVRLIRRGVKEENDRAEVTAAVWRRPELGHDRYLQAGAQWVREGLLDLFMPMIYTDNVAQLRSDSAAWKEATGEHAARMVVGLGAYKVGGEGLREQLAEVKGPVCIFDYSALEESRDPDQARTPEAEATRGARREAWLEFAGGVK